MIVYEESTKLAHVLYKYQYRGTRHTQRYEGEPTLLQFHPRKPSEVVQIYFPGYAPEWINSFASKHQYRLITSEGEHTGFALISNEHNSRVTTTPLFRAKVHDWFQNCHSSYSEFRDQLLNNAEVVEKNLIYYPEIFKELGLYYRSEEFEGKTGALDYKDWCYGISLDQLQENQLEGWNELVNQLILARNYPEMEEEVEFDSPVIEIETTEEEEDNVTMDDEVIYTSEIETEQELEIDIEDLTSEDEIEINNQDFELEIVVEHEINEEVIEIECNGPIIESEVQEDTSACDTNSMELIEEAAVEIAEKTNKKEGIFEGQILLF
ncbi:TPA: hypothetical protein NJY08_004999 [Salmonella enterica subsp. enterica serovar Typhi str. AG3]|nr:hypothetical protein [Salmonella enterica subsp. enterica serovar Typhi str. AG3]